MKTSKYITIASLVFLTSISAWAGDSDVSGVDISKFHFFGQTSTSNPVETVWGLAAVVFHNNTGSVTGASFSGPASRTLTNDGIGNFRVFEAFASQNALDTAFPNGTYAFSIQSTSPPTNYTPSIMLTGDLYTNTPKILNTSFTSGALTFNAAQNFTFQWNSFSNQGGIGSSTYLRIDDDSGGSEPTLFFSFSPNTTSFTLPAGALRPNYDYSSELRFNNVTAFTDDNGTDLGASFGTNTQFAIHTVPEPSFVMLLALSVVAFGLGRRG